jgi:3-phosphoshikimate 1-carboxyvinyltransferase
MIRPLAAYRSNALRGTASVPGDKSISHRALILGSLTVGRSQISGLLEAGDVLGTAKVMQLLGAEVVREQEGVWHTYGVGAGGFSEPADILDFGNSGTGSRLVMGAMATTPIAATFTGDASLRKRPMKRVLEPLTLFGAEYSARDGGLMPVWLKGATRPLAIEHDVAVASAQVKSALLLAALNAPGRSCIRQSALTRDHTERMLKAFGAEIGVERLGNAGEAITVRGEPELRPTTVEVPKDPSSAAFPIAAALIVPGSEIFIPGVLLNPRRTGLFETLREMGAHLVVTNRRHSGGEEIGDLTARASVLNGVDVPPERAPSMIDEYPVLAVLAAFAEGRSVFRGLEELRVKESDRLSAIAKGLKVIGVNVEELADGLVIEGRGADGVRGGGQIETHMDHRIAMAFLVAGMAAHELLIVDDSSMIATSFPTFQPLMRSLGAVFQVPAM